MAQPEYTGVAKKEIIKWLDTGIIYPIFDSHWMSPTQIVPKKSELMVFRSNHGDLVPTRLFTGWHVCINYRKLNTATHKDHFSYHSLIKS